MSASDGVVVRGPIVPGDTTDVYPTHLAQYGQGGYRAVADVAARDAIPAERRTLGMVVHTIGTTITWQLRGGIANTNWVQISHTVTQAAAQADSVAANTAQMVVDFNALLAKLRTAGIMDT
jgi:hypothetical protein